MRTFNFSRTQNGSVVYNVSVKCPDAMAFAFNPCLFVFEDDRLVKASVTILDDEVSPAKAGVPLSGDAYGGKVFIDAREVVQGLFDTSVLTDVDYSQEGRSGLGKKMRFELAMEFADGETLEVDGTEGGGDVFTFFAVWGALKVGGQEVYNGHRTLTWFRKFPFTFGVYAAGGGSVLLSKDGVANRFVNLAEQGVWNIPLFESDNGDEFYLVHDCTGQFVEVTFDRTFDMTFRYSGGGTRTEKIRVNIDDSEDGIYLRWIDRFGFITYHLFKKGAESRKTTAGEFIRNDWDGYDEVFGFQKGNGRRQMYSREDTIPVCAPLVDSDMWDVLFDMVTSPFVDMFAGYDDNDVPRWVSVTAKAATFTKENSVLQDFVANIIMPEVPIQKQ